MTPLGDAQASLLPPRDSAIRASPLTQCGEPGATARDFDPLEQCQAADFAVLHVAVLDVAVLDDDDLLGVAIAFVRELMTGCRHRGAGGKCEQGGCECKLLHLTMSFCCGP